MVSAQDLIDFEKEIGDTFNRGEIKAPVHLYSGNETLISEVFKEIDIEKRERFIKPTLQELQEYISTREIKIDAQKFLNHYDSVGWKVSNNPMKDWKACVRTWEGRNYNTTNNQQKPTGMPKPNYNDPNYYKDDGGFYD